MGNKTRFLKDVRARGRRDRESLMKLFGRAMEPTALASSPGPDAPAEEYGVRLLARLVQYFLLDEGALGTDMRTFVLKLCRREDPLRKDLTDEQWAVVWPALNALQHARLSYVEHQAAVLKAKEERDREEREEKARREPELPGLGEPPGAGVLRPGETEGGSSAEVEGGK